MASVIIRLSSTVSIIFVVIAPKLLCRHYHEPKEYQATDAAANEYQSENDIGYGETNFLPETQTRLTIAPLILNVLRLVLRIIMLLSQKELTNTAWYSSRKRTGFFFTAAY